MVDETQIKCTGEMSRDGQIITNTGTVGDRCGDVGVGTLQQLKCQLEIKETHYTHTHHSFYPTPRAT